MLHLLTRRVALLAMTMLLLSSHHVVAEKILTRNCDGKQPGDSCAPPKGGTCQNLGGDPRRLTCAGPQR